MRTQVRRRGGALLLSLAVTAGAAGCTASDAGIEPAASSTPVALQATGAPSQLTVGVVVSLASPLGQGADWNAAAEGAQVAAYRYGLGDVKVRIVPEDDKGSAAGARDAVRRLVGEHVSGIVMATEGDHLRSALAEAHRTGVPVLLPYDAPASDLSSTTWSTGPDDSQVGAALAGTLRDEALATPLLVDAGGGGVPHVAPAARVRLRPGDDPDAAARSLLREARTRDVDALVVSGPAELQGRLVAALQGVGTELPVFLTPQALSPSFATALTQAGGSLDADLTTVGTSGGDTTTLQAGTAGRAASGFYAALRSAADDTRLEDFFDGRPFARVAGGADSRSHDAVVALVTAAARAGSADPGAVRQALGRLVVTSADGLAGPTLDFRHRSAVDSREVTALHATTQDPGVTPPGAAQIHWFASSTS